MDKVSVTFFIFISLIISSFIFGKIFGKFKLGEPFGQIIGAIFFTFVVTKMTFFFPEYLVVTLNKKLNSYQRLWDNKFLMFYAFTYLNLHILNTFSHFFY